MDLMLLLTYLHVINVLGDPIIMLLMMAVMRKHQRRIISLRKPRLTLQSTTDSSVGYGLNLPEDSACQILPNPSIITEAAAVIIKGIKELLHQQLSPTNRAARV
jgi:hypothetical protein